MIRILKITGWLLLLLNLVILCRYILFKNQPGTYRVQTNVNPKRQSGINTIPFASVKKIYHSSKSSTYKFTNIAGNVLGFLPLGFLLPFVLFHRWGVALSILSVCLLSIAFEYIQLYTGCGVFDVDDILLNSLGGITGALLWGLGQLLYCLVKKTGQEEVNYNIPDQSINLIQHS